MIKGNSTYRYKRNPGITLCTVLMLFVVISFTSGLTTIIVEQFDIEKISLVENCEHETDKEEKNSKYENDFDKYLHKVHLSTDLFYVNSTYKELILQKSKNPSLDIHTPPPKKG